MAGFNKRVIGYLAEEVWTTIDALNAAIDDRVAEINTAIRRVDGSTRWERFESDEAPLLGALPDDGFATVEWKQLKVGRNYHVSCDSQYYSVPYTFAGQLLRVRLTAQSVTIFDGDQLVCEHSRRHGRKGQYSTVLAHAPKAHQGIDGLWSRQWFTDRARGFGPATEKVIAQILDRHVIETQGYLDCQNILETLGKRSRRRLEAASQVLVNQNGAGSYSVLKRVMAAIDSGGKVPRPAVTAAATRKAAATGGRPRRRRGPGPVGRSLCARAQRGGCLMFTEIDHQKFRSLRITHVATRFEELTSGEANDELTPEQIFLTAVDEALDSARRIGSTSSSGPRSSRSRRPRSLQINYQEGRAITPLRMKRYAGHHWR